MVSWAKSNRLPLMALLAVIVSFAEAANESVALVETQQDDEQLTDHNPAELAVKMPVSGQNTVVWSLTWVGSANGNVPPGAVEGGLTKAGEKLYIGRAYYGEDLLPGKVHPSHKRLYVSSGGKEHYFSHYEVLVEVRRELRWIAEEELID